MTSPAYEKGKRIGAEVRRLSLAGQGWESVRKFLSKEGATDLLPSAKAMFERLSNHKEGVA